MDKDLFFHTVASETAKAYVSSNMPQYIHDGSQKFAEDFSEKYFEAYKVAQKMYDKNKVRLKTDGLI